MLDDNDDDDKSTQPMLESQEGDSEPFSVDSASQENTQLNKVVTTTTPVQNTTCETPKKRSICFRSPLDDRQVESSR